MAYNVSDFKIASSILCSICEYHNVKFIDIEVKFDKDNKTGFLDGKIFIGNPKRLSQSIYKIISICLENFEQIYGISVFCNDVYRFNLLNTIFSYLRGISSDEEEELVWQRLYQQEIVWTIMKDIICPAFKVNINNCLLALYNTPWVDIACYSEENNFILLNTGIENQIVKQAALLCEVIKIHELNPKDVISEIEGTEIIDKIKGVANLAFPEECDALDFIIMIKVFAGLKISENWTVLFPNGSNIKTAQTSGPATSWWFLGIIEQLLEPSRGSDWSTYKALEPFHKEVQDRIDKARVKAGREGLTYEALLRTFSGEVKPEDVKLIERNLASDRIW